MGGAEPGAAVVEPAGAPPPGAVAGAAFDPPGAAMLKFTVGALCAWALAATAIFDSDESKGPNNSARSGEWKFLPER